MPDLLLILALATVVWAIGLGIIAAERAYYRHMFYGAARELRAKLDKLKEVDRG